VVVIDKSPSQEFGDRPSNRSGARADRERLGRFRRRGAIRRRPARPTARPTARGLFNALTTALSDVPHDRVAGALIVTDGRVHDVRPTLRRSASLRRCMR
jgi:hypothetical protein